MNYININGKITAAEDARIPVDNGAFRYGYGLFETMMVRNGTIRLKQYHWDRLFTGLKLLHFDIPALMSPEWLEEQVLATLKRNKQEQLCRVRLQMFAGGGGLYGLTTAQPQFAIECFPLEEDTLKLNENGLVAGIATGVSKSIDSLANLKSCNALIYAIAARQAKENRWNDALICNTAGNIIIESTIANLFWVKDDVIYTPPLTDGCIAGVMRRHIMSHVAVQEQSLSSETLLQADEVFLTNAIKMVRWVGMVNNTTFGNNQAKKIHALLVDL